MDRQKILLIFAGAWISAALLTWFLYAKTKAPKIETLVKVLAAADDMPAGTSLKKADLKWISVPQKDLSKVAVIDEKAALGHVLLYPVNANEPITSTKLTSMSGAQGLPATIDVGKRAISIPITDTSGVAGLIQPRSSVDVLFTRTGSMSEALSTIILEDVTVLSIGRFTEAQSIDPKAPRQQNQAATLLVTPEDARKLELAKNQGKISLALRNPLDRSRLENPVASTVEDLDPIFFGRGNRRPGRVPNVRDPKVWAGLTGEDEEKPRKEEKKEPPKPRLVVDVFRGDKHVQEIFQ